MAALPWLIAIAPLAKLLVDALTDRLGADPVAMWHNRLGFWSLVWLLSSLACTPLSRWTGRSLFARWRRPLGLAAFGWACLHGLSYLVLDQGMDVGAVWDDVIKRRFIAVGLLAWLLLLPLAITSTQGWMRRLGGVRWRRLHTLVFPAASLALLHQLWRYKIVEIQSVVFIAVATVLALARWRRKASAQR